MSYFGTFVKKTLVMTDAPSWYAARAKLYRILKRDSIQVVRIEGEGPPVEVMIDVGPKTTAKTVVFVHDPDEPQQAEVVRFEENGEWYVPHSFGTKLLLLEKLKIVPKRRSVLNKEDE